MNRAIYSIVAAIGLLASNGSLFAAAGSTAADAELSALLREHVDQAKRGTCVVAGIVDQAGSRIVSYGHVSRTSDRTADGETVFEIGSTTKAFTGLLLAEMVERGEVALDDPVARFLPASVKVPARGGRQITLVDLATQTSGLPRLPDNLAPRNPANPYADYTPEQMYAFLSNYVLTRDVGAKYEYSNLGVGLLGHALARRAGMSYEALLTARICRPLGMNDTRIALPPGLKARLAQGYTADGQPMANWDLPTLAGAGALRSTANDLVKFVSANLGLTASALTPAMQLAQKPRHDAGSPSTNIGLCWHISKSFSGDALVWHNGETGGYHAFVCFDPKHKRGAIVLSNAASSIDDIGFHLLDARHPVGRAPRPQVAGQRTPVKLPPQVLDGYAGRYELAPNVFFNLRRDGDRLMAQLTGQAYFEIFPQSETEFYYTAADAQLSFVKDAAGRVKSLVLHQNGVDQPAPKISDQPPARRQAIKLDPKLYDAYVGEYALAPGAAFTIRRDKERLLSRLTGQDFFEIFPESETEFFYDVVDAQITFEKDKSGHVSGLILHQNGQELHAKRSK